MPVKLIVLWVGKMLTKNCYCCRWQKFNTFKPYKSYESVMTHILKELPPNFYHNKTTFINCNLLLLFVCGCGVVLNFNCAVSYCKIPTLHTPHAHSNVFVCVHREHYYILQFWNHWIRWTIYGVDNGIVTRSLLVISLDFFADECFPRSKAFNHTGFLSLLLLWNSLFLHDA